MKKNTANIVLLITSTAFCLLSIEILSRIYFPKWEGLWQHQFIRYSTTAGTSLGIPNFKGEMQDLYGEYKININLDQNGFRNSKNEPTKIYLLGDSFAFGWGVNKSFSEIAEEKINYEIKNLAIPGADIVDYFLIAKSFIKPNTLETLIVAITTENDIRKYDQKISAKKEVLGLRKILKSFFENSAAFNLMAIKALHNNLLLTIGRKLNVFGASEDQGEMPPTAATLGLLEKINAEFSPKRMIVIPIPPRNGAKMQEMYLDFLTSLRSKKDFEILEIQEDQSKTRFAIDGHWNQYGHELVANNLAKMLN